MDNERQHLIDRLDKARATLNALLVQIDAQTEIYHPWKLKQLLDHIAGWDDAVIAAIQSHANGELPVVTAPRGVDYYNAETVTTRESLPLEHTRREFDVTRQYLRQLILNLPEVKFCQPFISPWGEECTVVELVEVFIHHEYEHAQDLEKIIEGSQLLNK